MHLFLPRGILPVLSFSAALASQCEPQWQPGDPLPHVTDSVGASVTWDPDGVGPAPSVLVVGGNFRTGFGYTKVATYDGVQWTPLGSLADSVTALSVFNGQLVAASYGGGSSGAGRVWSWNGTSWQPLGASGIVLGGTVSAMTTYNGALIVGGYFQTVDGVAVTNLAAWNGSAWSPVGSGVVGSVHALAVFNNTLHAGGSLTGAGVIPIFHHAVWNGSTWAAGGNFNAPVHALAVRVGLLPASSYLFVGGAFTTVTSPAGTIAAQHVARLTSAGVWSAMGAGLGGTRCKQLFVRYLGAVGYELTAATDESLYMAWQWTGSAWTNLAYVTDPFPTLQVATLGWFNGQYVLGLSTGDVAMRTYDPTQGWIALRGKGIEDYVAAQCFAGGDLVIGGGFRRISGVTMNCIARGHANAWQPLGTGIDGGNGVFALATMPNGDIVAGGDFATAGGVQVGNVARWNGTAWAPLGLGINGVVYALTLLPNGDLVAAGAFSIAGGVSANRIARWNGSAWSPLGIGANGNVNAMAVLPNGDLVAGGSFTQVGGLLASRIARWNGSVWSPLGSGVNDSVYAVLGTNDGSVVAGGHFTIAGGLATPYCARWNGTAWESSTSSLGFQPTSSVLCLAALPDGDVVAGGAEWQYLSSFPPSFVQTNLARLDRNNGLPLWSSLRLHGASVSSLLVLPDGSLSAGGTFDTAGTVRLGNLAHLVPPCLPSATSFGSGCNGATLTAATLPWNESTFRAVGTGLPTTAIVLTVTSVTPVPQGVAPLSLVFSQALPSCDVLVAPDILGVLVTTTGTASSELFVAPSPSLVGVTFFHQMVPIAVDAQGAWTSVTATNALQLTAGAF